MARRKTKKLRNLIIFLLFTFIIFLFFLNHEHNYTISYDIKDIKIKESYDKKSKYYLFEVAYDNKTYEIVSESKYINKRKLIKDINITKEKSSICLSFESKLSLYDVCSNEDTFYFPNKKETFKENSSYKNIKIDNLNNKTYLLWNYSEFIYINKDDKKEIKLFNKDIYKLNLIYQTDKYLLIPNYDESYKFTKVYLLNKNSKVKDFHLRYEVYFDSYILGDYKNKVYLYDNKSEIEYYFDIKKQDIYKTNYQIYINGKWEKVTNQKLKNNKLKFSNENIFNYSLKDGKLYASDKYLVTNLKVSKIIKTDNLDIFYLSDDTLYYFNPLKGEKPLLKYSEWEFNNTNMIFIF